MRDPFGDHAGCTASPVLSCRRSPVSISTVHSVDPPTCAYGKSVTFIDEYARRLPSGDHVGL